MKSVMERYGSDASVMRSACLCLSNMCKEGDVALAIGTAGLVPFVMHAVRRFQDPDFVYLGGLVLQKVAEAQEMSGPSIMPLTSGFGGFRVEF